MPEFKVDKELSKHLNQDALLQNINHSHFGIFCGSKGSGKTSLFTSLLNTKKKFKKVFHNIYLVMPTNSRKSMKDDVFDQLPEERKFDNLTIHTLRSIYNMLLENKEEGPLSLIVLDDCQSELKDPSVESALLHIVSNSRHLLTSIWLIAQNYMLIPKQLRIKADFLFLFNIGKQEYMQIFDDWLQLDKSVLRSILNYYTEEKKKDKYSFIFLYNKGSVVFVNYHQLIFSNTLSNLLQEF
jgi:energy-coupling factor transporter ATP-binding protein EcfA2